MEVVFDEIMVGERGRAHEVLASTLPGEVSRSLAHNLDLPGQLPPGAQLESYVSGFPQGSRYVFARTSLDPSAARQGMVFSHALVADATVVNSLTDIACVFGALKAERPITCKPSAITIDVSNDPQREYPPAELCDLLSTSSDSPVVVVGPSALENIIITLWPQLLPSMRSELRFRMSFGPEETDVSSIHIVAVPRIAATRWPEDSIVEGGAGGHEAHTAGGRFLTGQLVGNLSRFLSELAITCMSFRTLDLCCRALELSNAERGFTQALAGLRLIGSLQPDPNKGKAIKAACLDHVTLSPGPKSMEEFLSLRNLDLSPFAEREGFKRKLAAGFNNLVENTSNIDALLPIAEYAFKPGQATEAWQESFQKALSNMSSLAANSVSQLIWSAYSTQPDLARSLLEAVDEVPFMDKVMSGHVAGVTVSDINDASVDLVSAGFVLSEATLLVEHCGGDLHEALRRACKRNRRQFGDHAIKHVLSEMKPEETIEAALQISDKKVLSAAADAVVTDPVRLDKYSLRVPQLRALWQKALTLDGEAWKIRQDVRALREEMFDCLLEGELEVNLLTKLEGSPLVNALDYSRRSALWPALPPTSKSAVERSTGEAWIQALPGNVSSATFLRPEEELSVVLGGPQLEQPITTVLEAMSFSQVLDVLAGNEYLRESLLRGVFSKLYNPMSPPGADEMQRLGRLVSARGWRSFSRYVMKEYGVQGGLLEFFEICADHLDFWDRWRHGISEPTRKQLYDLFVKTACELYPTGPMDAEIWYRAGGNPSKLDMSGSGQRRWEEAVRKIRYGNRVRTENLILQMREDYPLNEKLEYLEHRLK